MLKDIDCDKHLCQRIISPKNMCTTQAQFSFIFSLVRFILINLKFDIEFPSSYIISTFVRL